MSEPIERATYKFFIEGLIRQIRAKNIMEIGLGAEGYGAKACLDYLSEKYPILYGGPIEKGKYVVLDFDPKPEAINLLNKYDKSYWELRIGDTQKDQHLFQNCHDNRFDVILVDGSHWITHVINDIQNCIINGCAKDDTIFVFHDSDSSHVRQALIIAAQQFKIELFNIPKANLCLGRFSTSLS